MYYVTGPILECIIRNVNPIDSLLSSVRYDVQVSLPGPVGLSTGPYVYRESRSDIFNTNSLFSNTSITQETSYDESFTDTIITNFQSHPEISFFYSRAENNARSYFINMYGSQTIKGYTGSSHFSGSGLSGSWYN